MTVYLNGSFLPIEQAAVSVMDRGFLFGDGAYEVVPAYSRRPFRLAQHLLRLQRTLDALRLPNPHPDSEWTRLVREVIARNEPEDQSIYIQVTRGTDLAKRNHAFPIGVAPTVFVMSEPLLTPPAEQREQGVCAVSAADFRWLRCDLKTVSLLGNCLLRQLAIDAGCGETLLFRDGFLTEGAASNIFVVKAGRILTPPRSHLMLAGVTYDVILELAQRDALPHEVREILEAEVRAADEIWMSSSTKEVLPITRLDGRQVGTGRPGPLFARMYARYQDFKANVMRHGD
jgi:D-alanine transaminase